jgi:hypothetical protein
MIQASRAARWAVLASFLAIGACRTVSAPPVAVPPPAPSLAPPLPATPPPAVAPEPARHYRIDAERSQVLILVYRDGPMARLGHNHVLSLRGLSGYVSMLSGDVGESFSLQFPVAAMSVDEPALRAEQGDDFSAAVDAASIDGTREHMLSEKLLDAMRFPNIRVRSQELRAEGDHWIATLQITVRDHVSMVEAPVALVANQEQVSASGEFDLTHAQLGLTPYSVGLGALRVAETIHVRYRLLAQRELQSGTDADHP